MNGRRFYQLQPHVISLCKGRRLVTTLYIEDRYLYVRDYSSGGRLRVDILTGAVSEVASQRIQAERPVMNHRAGIPAPSFGSMLKNEARGAHGDSKLMGEAEKTVQDKREELIPYEVRRAPYLGEGTQLVIEKMASQQVSADELYKALNQLKKLDGTKLSINYVAGWLTKEGKKIEVSDLIEFLEKEDLI